MKRNTPFTSEELEAIQYALETVIQSQKCWQQRYHSEDTPDPRFAVVLERVKAVAR